MVKTIDNYEEIDAKNKKQFQMTGCRECGDDLYICVLCGKPANIDNSYSNRGHNLIHSAHYYAEDDYDKRKELHKFVWDDESYE